MLTFKKAELSDRHWVQKIYEASGFRGCEYTFANLYLWSSEFGAIANYETFLTQRLQYQGRLQYIYPAGCCKPTGILALMREDAHSHGQPLVIRSLTKETRAVLEDLYPAQFTYREDRDAFDYLYEIDTLAELKGRAYQSTRNHINRFLENFPGWYTEEITPENLPVCQRLFDHWMTAHEADGDGDRRAMERAFRHFEELRFEGLILYAEKDHPVAFSMGNPISRDTFDVNFEKAFADVQGAYPLINREFARYVRAKYPQVRYLNREDDMGVAGLRTAKESYRPIFLEKYIATEIIK